MSRLERTKGCRAERDVAALLRPLFPHVRTKRAGGESAREDRGRDLLGTPAFCFQVKVGVHPYPLKALREAQAAALEDEMPVAICREDRQEWTATMPLEGLLALIALAREAGQGIASDALGDEPELGSPPRVG